MTTFPYGRWKETGVLWRWVTCERMASLWEAPRWMGPAYYLPHLHVWLYVVWPLNYLVWLWRWIELRFARLVDGSCRYDRDLIAANSEGYRRGLKDGRREAERKIEVGDVVRGATLEAWNQGYSDAFKAMARELDNRAVRAREIREHDDYVRGAWAMGILHSGIRRPPAFDPYRAEEMEDKAIEEARTENRVYVERLREEERSRQEVKKDWPRDCPKCGYRGNPTLTYYGRPWGYDGAFQVRYCRGRSPQLGCWTKAAWLVPTTQGEHLHHECRQCGLELMTYCVDAAPSPHPGHMVKGGCEHTGPRSGCQQCYQPLPASS